MSKNGLFCITESFHFENFNLIKYDMIKDSDACMIICSSLKQLNECFSDIKLINRFDDNHPLWIFVQKDVTTNCFENVFFEKVSLLKREKKINCFVRVFHDKSEILSLIDMS